MTTAGYLVSFTTLESDGDVIQKVLQTADQAKMLLVSTNNTGSTHLYIIPAGKESTQELLTRFQAIPGFSNISVVAFSNPIKGTEIADVRKLFAGFDWDAGSVHDDELSLFIGSRLEGLYTYYIYSDYKRNEKGLFPMHVRRVDEHPQFSPDWLGDTGSKKQGTGQHPEDMEVHKETVQKTAEVMPPPPPPLPPHNIDQMTDMEIRRWMRRNDPRNLKDTDMEIKRTAEEITITITRDGVAESVRYKLKK